MHFLKNYWLVVVAGIVILFCLQACKDEPIEPVNPNEPNVPVMPIDTIAIPAVHFQDETEVILNPSGKMPLVAQVNFTTNNEVSIQVQVLGDEVYEYTVAALDTLHSIPIVGLYPNHLNQINLIATDINEASDTISIEIQTEELPIIFPAIEILTKQQNLMEPGWNLCDFSYAIENELHTEPFMFDHLGNIRWYFQFMEEHRWVATIQRLQNGNWLCGNGWRLLEYDIYGFQVNAWPLEYHGQHHDVIEKPDGNFLVAANRNGDEYTLDEVIEIDRNTGTIIKEWTLTDYLDISRTALVNHNNDWFHMNSVWYSESDNTIIVSGRNQGIVKIGYDNELKWILAPHQDWDYAGIEGDGHDTNDYLLTAVNSEGVAYNDDIQNGFIPSPDFEWPWGQHSAMLLPNDNVFVFDNGFNRCFQGGFYVYSRAVEFEVNGQAKTVKEKWQYGKNIPELKSNIISDVDYLPITGNVLMAPGYNFIDDHSARIVEIQYPNTNKVFDAKINFADAYGTGSGWSQADLIYRSERVELYPY